MKAETAEELAKVAPPTVAGALTLGGVTLPDVVAFMTIVWLLVLIGEKAWKAWCWWVTRRGPQEP
jgi:hypothetical protein